MALAAAFQIFYDGQYTTPHLYTRILDRDGNIYLENNATSYQALTPQTATIMNQLLAERAVQQCGHRRRTLSHHREYAFLRQDGHHHRWSATCGSWAVRHTM